MDKKSLSLFISIKFKDLFFNEHLFFNIFNGLANLGY